MATSLDQVAAERTVKENEGKVVDDRDVEIAFRMAVQLLNEGGMDVIKQAINQSQDPAQVIGQMLAQIMATLAQKLQEQIEIDPSIFLAQGGWLDLVLDYIEKKLGYPSNFSDQIYTQVVEIIKAASKGPDAPNSVMEGGVSGEQTPEEIALSQQQAGGMQ